MPAAAPIQMPFVLASRKQFHNLNIGDAALLSGERGGAGLEKAENDREDDMYAVVRTYSGPGAKELFHLLEERKAEVEAAIRSVSGLVSYTLVRTEMGGTSVTVCKDKAGADESVRIAREWIRQHASALGSNPPEVEEGSVVVQIT